MTKTDTDHQAAEDERRRYLVATFGEDVLVGLATDQPARNSRPLGERVVQEHRRAEREVKRERAKKIMREALQVEHKADAYARVVEAVQAGNPVTPSDLGAAAHHALETGIVDPPSTVTRLIDQAALNRGEYRPMATRRGAFDNDHGEDGW